MNETLEPLEAEAKQAGWAPLEAWRGKPEDWVDAEEFVRRGRTVLPILRKENERLHGQLERTNADLKLIKDNMAEFVQYQQEQTLSRLADQRKQLLSEKRAADEAGNDAEVVRLEEQLDENAEARQAAKVKAAPTAASPATPPEPPELTAWRASNPWFGKDHRKTGLAMGLGREAVEKGLTGPAYFAHIDEGMKEIEPPTRQSKTESGGPSGGAGPTKTSSYSALPADAKAQCDADAKRFVGDKKMFKTVEAWRDHFCKLYQE